MQTAPDHLATTDGARLAFRHTPGRPPEVLFLGGFRSDMTGQKALALEAHCRGRGQGFTRFDYRGHGASSGRFEEGCVGDWLADALAVLDAVVPRGRPCVLVGSSMGGWIALLAALARPGRVRGLVGIAPAPDFTEELIRPRLTPEALDLLDRQGFLMAPSAYGDPFPITRRLLEDGARHLLLRGPIPLRVPVHLLHGQEDPDVPWRTSLRLAALLESPAVTVELVEDGDHRLSREPDLRRLAAAVDRVAEQAAALEREGG
jgi:pimeloyl-ACP methyl ester carboxylesterase